MYRSNHPAHNPSRNLHENTPVETTPPLHVQKTQQSAVVSSALCMCKKQRCASHTYTLPTHKHKPQCDDPQPCQKKEVA